jgi:hypothetical protein
VLVLFNEDIDEEFNGEDFASSPLKYNLTWEFDVSHEIAI